MKFSVKPISCKGHSIIQWEATNGLPRRSLQVETEIAHLWAASWEMYELLKEFQRTIDDDHFYRARVNECVAKAEGKL